MYRYLALAGVLCLLVFGAHADDRWPGASGGGGAYDPTYVSTWAELSTCLNGADTLTDTIRDGDADCVITSMLDMRDSTSGVTFSPRLVPWSIYERTIASVAEEDVTHVKLTTSYDHGWTAATQDWVRITGTTNYDGIYDDVSFPATNEVVIVHDFYGDEATGIIHDNYGQWRISCAEGGGFIWGVPADNTNSAAVMLQTTLPDRGGRLTLDGSNCSFEAADFQKSAGSADNPYAPLLSSDEWASPSQIFVDLINWRMLGHFRMGGNSGEIDYKVSNSRYEIFPIDLGISNAVNVIGINNTATLSGSGLDVRCWPRDNNEGMPRKYSCGETLVIRQNGQATLSGGIFEDVESAFQAQNGGSITMTGTRIIENQERDYGYWAMFDAIHTLESPTTLCGAATGPGIVDVSNVSVSFLGGTDDNDGIGAMNRLVRAGGGGTVSVDIASLSGCPDEILQISCSTGTSVGLPDRFYINAPLPNGCSPYLISTGRTVYATGHSGGYRFGSVSNTAGTIKRFVTDTTTITATKSSIAIGDYVVINGDTDYNGLHKVTNIAGASPVIDWIEIDDGVAFAGTATGSWWPFFDAVNGASPAIFMNPNTVGDIILPDRKIHIENSEVRMTAGGTPFPIGFCGLGLAGGADSFLQPNQTIADKRFGEAGCDGLGPHATVGAADEAVSPLALTATGMRCTARPTIATTDVLTFTLMDDTVAVEGVAGCGTTADSPDNYCNFNCDVTLAGTATKTCRAVVVEPKTIAAESLLAVRMESSGTDSMAATDFECVLEAEM